jgi:hypothetical protein
VKTRIPSFLLVLALSILACRSPINRPPDNFSDSGYYVRGDEVYYHSGFPNEPYIIPDADADSFVIIDTSYAKDATIVYFDGRPIPGADPSSFELLESTFSRDDQHVYVSGELFSDDPAGFEHIEGNIYRDSEHIYWSTSTVSDDPDGLRIIGEDGFYTYFADSTTVYINGNEIVDADPGSFILLQESYTKDAAHIYYFDHPILEVDSSTFEVIISPYSRDATQVFWMETPLPDADPATFKVLNADFQCSADAQTAYYQNLIIPNFDPSIIPAGSIVTNCDESGLYYSP